MNRDLMIIIVDDEMEALVHFLSQIIEESNVRYKFFNDNPLDAIEYVKDHPVDCAYLDIRMPKINGLDLATRLIEQNKDLKIVFITAFYFDEKEIKERFKDNIIDFVYKPFSYEAIRNTFLALEIDKHIVEFSMFGDFNCLVDGQAITFLSKKSEELLALIMVLKGKKLTMEKAISILWPERELDLAKRLYRDSIYKLRQKLNEKGIGHLVIFQRGVTKMNTNFTKIKCDYYDYLNNENDLYNGYFLEEYSWNKFFKKILDKKRALVDE